MSTPIFQEAVSSALASATLENRNINSLEFFIEGITGGTDAEQEQAAQELAESAEVLATVKRGNTSLDYIDQIPLNFFRRLMNQDGGYAAALTGFAAELGFLPLEDSGELRVKLTWDPDAVTVGTVDLSQASFICDAKRVPGYNFEGLSKIYKSTDQETGTLTHSREVTNLVAAYFIGSTELEHVELSFPGGRTEKEYGRNIRLDSAANTHHENEALEPLLRVYKADGAAVVEEVPSIKVKGSTDGQLVQMGVIRAGSVEEA